MEKSKEKMGRKNNELDKKLRSFYSQENPEIDYKSIVQKEGSATRVASSTVLGVLAKKVEI